MNKSEMSKKLTDAYQQGLNDATIAATKHMLQGKAPVYQLTNTGFISLVRELIHLNRRAVRETMFVVRLPLKWLK